MFFLVTIMIAIIILIKEKGLIIRRVKKYIFLIIFIYILNFSLGAVIIFFPGSDLIKEITLIPVIL